MQEARLPRFSGYDDAQWIRQQVRTGRHRDIIGGLWEELGSLQLAFLIGRGLQPSHSLIDIGAGSFRAGVKLIPYLDPGNYCAIDSQLPLLEAGYEREIEPAGLYVRFPRCNYAGTSAFELSGFERFFDYGLAQSVFTHMPLTRLLGCLRITAPFFRDGGVLFVTLFLAHEEKSDGPVLQVPGIVTYAGHDPYHTTMDALEEVSKSAPMWRMAVIGDWSHPHNQKMVSFTRF